MALGEPDDEAACNNTNISERISNDVQYERTHIHRSVTVSSVTMSMTVVFFVAMVVAMSI